MSKFKELGLSQEVVQVLDSMKITEPTEIQEKTIPLALEGKDIKGGSATGSGKTLAFASPILENLKSSGYVQALILTPTRELAEQVSQSIQEFSKHKKLNTLPIYGGVSIGDQVRKLAVADIVVGTPGRILDHLERKTLRLDAVKFLVLDEVDRMFDMGFRFDVEKIIRHCPNERQTMLFSATLTEDVNFLAKKYTVDPVEVTVQSYIDPKLLKQIYYDVDNSKKFSLLVHLLQNEKAGLVMVFCSTRSNVDFIQRNLTKNKIEAKAIHGGLSQNQRNRVLGKFHDNQISVMVCTDVAARGLDIKNVSHVYNYDLPKTSDDYVHRIGRTARAGKDGIAISLLSNRDYENFTRILENDEIKIEPLKLPKFDRIEITSSFSQNRSRGYGGGSRGGHSRGRDGPSRGRSSGPSHGRRDYNNDGPSRRAPSNGRRPPLRGPSNNHGPRSSRSSHSRRY